MRHDLWDTSWKSQYYRWTVKKKETNIKKKKKKKKRKRKKQTYVSLKSICAVNYVNDKFWARQQENVNKESCTM